MCQIRGLWDQHFNSFGDTEATSTRPSYHRCVLHHFISANIMSRVCTKKDLWWNRAVINQQHGEIEEKGRHVRPFVHQRWTIHLCFRRRYQAIQSRKMNTSGVSAGDTWCSSRLRPSQTEFEHICACSETSRRVSISGEDVSFPKQLTVLRKS